MGLSRRNAEELIDETDFARHSTFSPDAMTEADDALERATIRLGDHANFDDVRSAALAIAEAAALSYPRMDDRTPLKDLIQRRLAEVAAAPQLWRKMIDFHCHLHLYPDRSLTPITALRKANQAGSLQPTTLVSYKVEIDHIFDTRDQRRSCRRHHAIPAIG